MIKLYKRLADGSMLYHEAWAHGDKVVEHFGEVGTRGESRDHKIWGTRDAGPTMKQIVDAVFADGFREISSDDQDVLLIEYATDGWGNDSDLKKRHALEARMNETLGWTGLGHCDGGSIGSGTMEVCCMVVDFDLARKTIEDDLRGTDFADFARIYNGEDVG